MQTYAHVLPEVQKQVATKMDEILEPKPVATKPVSGKVGWLVSPLFCGAPGVTRTRDLLVRSQTLYPTELRALAWVADHSTVPDRAPLSQLLRPSAKIAVSP